MIEMVIHEKSYRQLFQGRFLLVDGIVYSVNRWQENLIRYLSKLVPSKSGHKKSSS